MALRFVIVFLCINCICGKLVDLSCADIRMFVDEHNRRRLEVASGRVPGQPPATNMEAMIWDQELAEKAAEWAAENTFQHNPDRSIESKRFKTGENLFKYGTTKKGYKLNPKKAVDAWFEEHKDYEFRAMSSRDVGKPVPIGHYTQMVWAESNRLGCAISAFREGRYNQYLAVCNYGPAGNILGKTAYKKGSGIQQLNCTAKECNKKYGTDC